MANVFNFVKTASPAEHLALEVYPREVRLHERVLCHTRISKTVYCLYKAPLSPDAKQKGRLFPFLLVS